MHKFIRQFLILWMLMVSFNNAFASQQPILIFVSFSMPRESLKQWLQQAKAIHAVVVIRGLINHSFQQTAKATSELIGHDHNGLQIDPTLFKKFSINKVPAVVISDDSTSQFDVIYGNVSLRYALEKISRANIASSSIAARALKTLNGKYT